MTTEHIALLTLISQGNYLPQLHAPYSRLAYLFRQGLIVYRMTSVECTEAGRALLAEFKLKEPAR